MYQGTRPTFMLFVKVVGEPSEKVETSSKPQFGVVTKFARHANGNGTGGEGYVDYKGLEIPFVCNSCYSRMFRPGDEVMFYLKKCFGQSGNMEAHNIQTCDRPIW